MDSVEYWSSRAEQRVLMGEKTASELLSSMKVLYKNSLNEINKEIEAFYGRYATENGLSLSDVHKRLDPSQLRTAREHLKEYYDKVESLRVNGKVDPSMLKKYKDELRLLSARSYMSRLEELKSSLRDITFNLGAKESEAYYQTLSKIYKDGYFHTTFDIEQYFGFTGGEISLNYKILDSALRERWLGMNYSDRIWSNKGKLTDELNTTFLQGVAQGKHPREIARVMAKNYGTAYYNCERLCRTESANIAEMATARSYADNGVDKYKFLATLDNRTSDICKSLDGEVYDLKNKEVGVNYPPMHPNCRSTTIPYFPVDDIDLKYGIGERVARNNDGKLYYVPSDMTYKQWEQTFVNPNLQPTVVVPQSTQTVQTNVQPSQVQPAVQIPQLVDDVKSQIRSRLEALKVDVVDVNPLIKKLDDYAVIHRLCGGDKTRGSCVSVACAYVANKAGFDVLDFRGGSSRKTFSSMWHDLTKMKGVSFDTVRGTDDYSGAKSLLAKMKAGKTYMLNVGKHCSIVRLGKNNAYEYLEMQSPNVNGWRKFDYYGSIDRTLKKRFGCQHSHTLFGSKYSVNSDLIDIETLGKNSEFIKLMSYVNTARTDQRKGKNGSVK